MISHTMIKLLMYLSCSLFRDLPAMYEHLLSFYQFPLGENTQN